jgi:hypothetical protein
MKLRLLPVVLVFGASALVFRAFGNDVSFPAGSFENGTASSWEQTQSGTATVTTPTENGNTFGRINITGTGTGTLGNVVPTLFLSNSVYVVTLDVRSSTMAALASGQLTLQIVDGNGNVVKQLSQDEMLNAFGTNATSSASTLTPLLQAIAGDSGLLPELQVLLTDVSASSSPDALLASIQHLIDTLVGQDPSVLTKLVDVLDQVLAGTLDITTLTDTQLGNLLNVGSTSPLIAAVRDLVTFLPAQNGPIVALEDVLKVLTTGEITGVDNLLAAIVGDGNLLTPVTNILTYALGDGGLLSSLTTDQTRNLMGSLDPSQSAFQPVSAIFSTTATPPPGAMGVQISSGAGTAASQTADVDNIAVRQFSLASPPVSGPLLNQPQVIIFGRSVRKTPRDLMVLRGAAIVPSGTAAIARVQYSIVPPGKHHAKFRNARGTARWSVRVPLTTTRTRVFVRAIGTNGLVSPTRRVVIIRTTPPGA